MNAERIGLWDPTEEVLTSWKRAIIEGAVVVLCPVEVLSRRHTQHQHKHIAHIGSAAGQHGTPEAAAKSLLGHSSSPSLIPAHMETLWTHYLSTPAVPSTWEVFYG